MVIPHHLDIILDEKSLQQRFEDGMHRLENGQSVSSTPARRRSRSLPPLPPLPPASYLKELECKHKECEELELDNLDRPSTADMDYPDDKEGSVAGDSAHDGPTYAYPTPVRLFLLSVGLALIVFTVALDNTVSEHAWPWGRR